MKPNDTDRSFAGSIPQLYEELMVPLIFAPYAVDAAARAVALKPRSVLEVAAGTGVVTRQLARELPADCDILATDLNPPMLEHARSLGTARPVRWQRADAMSLPFDDASFDLVVCQFGAMFFPDKPQAFAHARRVLKPGGTFLFSVWDRIETNELADVVRQSLAERFPTDPPRFLARTPHGHFDHARLRSDLVQAGFAAEARIDVVSARSIVEGAWRPALAYCQGTPLRNEIEARDPAGLERATRHAAAAIERRFGTGRIDSGICAHVISVTR